MQGVGQGMQPKVQREQHSIKRTRSGHLQSTTCPFKACGSKPG